MKLWFPFASALILSHCLYIVREPRDVAASQNVQPPPVSVALVGFYPYVAKDITPPESKGAGQKQVAAELVYSGRLKQLLGIGRPAAEYIGEGTDYTVPPERVQEFADTYIKAVGESGRKELEVLTVKEEGKLRVRNLKAQFVVLGIHLPALEETRSPIATLVTTITSAITFGILPQYAQFVGTSRFLIYDNKLNLRKTVEYKSEYVRLFSIVLIPFRNDQVEGIPEPLQSPYPRAWDSDVLDFRVALSRFLVEETGAAGGGSGDKKTAEKKSEKKSEEPKAQPAKGDY